MARDYIRNIKDMERYYYGAGNAMGYSYSGSELLKADAPMLSTTAGTYQAIYGRKVPSQLEAVLLRTLHYLKQPSLPSNTLRQSLRQLFTHSTCPKQQCSYPTKMTD